MMGESMKNLTPAVAAAVTGGQVRGALPEAELTAVTTDSRTVLPGCLFAAIPGARMDGHDFMGQAAEKGAACVLCERFTDVPVPQILVTDAPAALRALAAWYRRQFDIPFVGVTGSVGKTTAKEMIASVLAQRFETLKTEKNFNNELGVPLTLFRLREGHLAAVVEMGISGFGEMRRLTQMVRPDIGVYTVIGDAHLEFLGDRAGVLRAKGEMVEGMGPESVIIANGDDALLKEHDFGRRTVLFGQGGNAAVRAEDVRADGLSGMRCVICAGDRRIPVRIPAFGAHMVSAALMGAAVGLELGMTDREIARGVEAYETLGSRGRVIGTGCVTVLDDCYNANPTSVRSALESLTCLPGRKVAILGDMRELGATGPALHRETGALAAEICDAVVACGAEAEQIAVGAGPEAVWFPTREELLEALPDLVRKGDAVLVKASRAMGFEAVTEALLALETVAD